MAICFIKYNMYSYQQSKIGYMANQTPNYTVADCRVLVKTLVSGVKTITWGTASCKAPNMGKYYDTTITLENRTYGVLKLWN